MAEQGNPVHDELLVTHPDAVVLQRKGVLYAGRLSGSVAWIPLAGPDLVLLFPFLSGATPAEAACALMTGELSGYMPAPPPLNNVVARVDQLQKSAVLQPGAQRGDAGRVLQLPAPGQPAPDSLTASFRLPANFLLRLVPGGFEVWNAARDRSYRLGLDLALLLVAFGQGQSLKSVVRECRAVGDPAARRRAVQWLVDERLVVPGRVSSSATPDVAEDAGRGRDRPVGPETASWRTLEPDGRIPVYFVPHMENHYPLALGMIFSALSAHDGGALLERYQLLPISFHPTPKDMFDGPYRKFGPGIWLFSNYMWSMQKNLAVSEAIKGYDPRNLTVHGGPSTPGYDKACRAFMARYPSVDIAVHGEGEVTITEVFSHLERSDDGGIRYRPEVLSDVSGISFRLPGEDKEAIARSLPRPRLRALDQIPSPYLQGVFDGYEGRVDAAIVETNRGCPFACTFCDWGSATNGKVVKFDMDRTRGEIEWIGRNRVRVLWIADANFGMLRRDTEIAEWIVDVKRRYGFPQEVVVNYTKNATSRLADIIKTFTEGQIISQGIISIQTSDARTLDVINRENIKTDKYDELIGVFDEAGLPLSTDLMIGLPGITVAAFDQDLQRYIDADVQVKAYPTQLLPNSPMADPEYIEKYRIEVDENDFLVSCFSYSRDELKRMKAIYEVYVATEGYGALRYVMRFLQWEHGKRAIDFLHELNDAVRRDPGRFPSITWVLAFFNTNKCMPGGWRRFYDEVRRFIREDCGIEPDAALEVVLRANELAMPDESVVYPRRERLRHDFVAWFRDHNVRVGRPEVVRPLASYPPGTFEVDDPDGMASIDLEYQQYDSHQYFWELRSAVARSQSSADIKGKRPSFSAMAS
ncbi:radical SAM protein [Wenzhouxiangella sp. XN24]|uniref:B12-binding domain-containing radical SAM protein n=1 Tax=Wenzhouxiangella sp. XN24 TaxID=2713569 RepID=UPI0013EBC7B4|nr:radical SAM protein [Wenzhouxiangella sp. XN24]NGX15302.1 radical SAM protein [Wenzhouxiangella sp. XN24]